MNWTRRQSLQFGMGALAAASGLQGAAAQDYPSRPITLVVPFAPGGGLDMIARQLQPLLEQRLGKPLLIENRPGAGTMIGAAAVAPYDPVRDFVPIAMIGNAAFVFVVTPDLGVNTLADFITLAKDNPRQLSFGSGGNGSIQHLFAELLQTMAGIRMVHVPYRGDNPVLSDIVAGHIPAAFVEMGVAMPFISAGKVRALGVSSSTRVPAMPDVPTVAEAGVRGFSAVSWQMFVAPVGTPPEIVERLHADVIAVLAQPEVRDDFVRAGRIPAQPLSIPEMQDYMKSEFARWAKVVQDAGISASQ
jgi:tripartite-type tricarboxylate transporter receptor subunit TctC